MIKHFLFFSSLIICFMTAILLFKKPVVFKCNDPIGCITIESDAPVKIGVLQALSGKVQYLGMEQIRGIELALESHNNQILGHPIQLQQENSLCTSEGGTIASLKITADPNIIGVIGTTCSGAATTASKIISQAGMVMISGNNSAPPLTSTGGTKGNDWQPGYFRTSFNDAISGKAVAFFALEKLGITKAATINDGDVYTKGLTDNFNYAFEQMGGKIVFNTTINKGDKNMRPVLEAVIASNAELLFFPLFQPEGDFIVNQSVTMPELEGLIFMGNGALLTATFIDSVQDNGIGMYFVGPAPYLGSDYDKLKKRYQEKYKQSPTTTYYSFAYDATNLFLNAIKKTAVKAKNETLIIGRESLRQTIYSTIKLKGISGMLTCDEFGDCGAARFNIVRLDNPDTGLEGLEANIIYTFSQK